MYLVIDNYGTRQRAWSRAEALDWLRYCAPHAIVRDLFGRVVATRTVEAA